MNKSNVFISTTHPAQAQTTRWYPGPRCTALPPTLPLPMTEHTRTRSRCHPCRPHQRCQEALTRLECGRPQQLFRRLRQLRPRRAALPSCGLQRRMREQCRDGGDGRGARGHGGCCNAAGHGWHGLELGGRFGWAAHEPACVCVCERVCVCVCARVRDCVCVWGGEGVGGVQAGQSGDQRKQTRQVCMLGTRLAQRPTRFQALRQPLTCLHPPLPSAPSLPVLRPPPPVGAAGAVAWRACGTAAAALSRRAAPGQ